MAQVGRKPKPVEVKMRNGNPGGRKLPALTPVASLPQRKGIPDPHRPLMTARNGGLGAGQQLWRMIWESGAPWLREDDAELVMLVCEQTDERTLLRNRMFTLGLDWRERAALRSLEKQIAQILSQLGFSPTDRARLGMNSQRTDALQEFRDKVAAKRISS